MAQVIPPQGPARPQPNVYTLLVILAVIALIVATAVVLNHLMSNEGYGMTFGQLFKKAGELIPSR